MLIFLILCCSGDYNSSNGYVFNYWYVGFVYGNLCSSFFIFRFVVNSVFVIIIVCVKYKSFELLLVNRLFILERD